MVTFIATHSTLIPLLSSVPLTVNTLSCAVVENGSTDIPEAGSENTASCISEDITEPLRKMISHVKPYSSIEEHLSCTCDPIDAWTGSGCSVNTSDYIIIVKTEQLMWT